MHEGELLEMFRARPDFCYRCGVAANNAREIKDLVCVGGQPDTCVEMADRVLDALVSNVWQNNGKRNLRNRKNFR